MAADENGSRAEVRGIEESAGEATASAPEDEDAGGGLLRLVIAGDAPDSPARIDGMMTGRMIGLRDGCPVVDYPAGPRGGVPARAIVDVVESDTGREVALMFDGGSPARPVVMGIVRAPAPGELAASALEPPATERPPAPGIASLLSVSVDGDAVVLSAEREIVLRCGKASLTLTREGHVVLRGEYILSRAAGVNRIKGGSVQIN